MGMGDAAMITPNGFYLGARKSLHDSRDHVFANHPHSAAMAAAPLKPVTDLRASMPAPWDQSYLGSCEAHGCPRAALPFWHKAVPTFMPSRLAAYAWAREKGNIPLSEDSGCFTRDMLKVMVDGLYDEMVWSYNPSLFSNVPLEDIERPFKISGYTQLNTVEELSVYINAGNCAPFSMSLPDYFEDVQTTGIVKPYDGETIIGVHCMCAVGQILTGAYPVAIVCNSWGDGWADHGYCTIPFSMILDKKIGGDCWALYYSNNM
jgi:hypothetical protein